MPANTGQARWISARARERYKVAAVKDDRFDAFVLADTLRFDHAHWRPLSIPSPLLAEIKALTRDQDRLLENTTASRAAISRPAARSEPRVPPRRENLRLPTRDPQHHFGARRHGDIDGELTCLVARP